VVDKNDPVELAKGVETLVDDQALRENLSTAAYARAAKDFDEKSIKKKFFDILESRYTR
jgi:glycosyltransferase involved in cell wall biosynthesis